MRRTGHLSILMEASGETIPSCWLLFQAEAEKIVGLSLDTIVALL